MVMTTSGIGGALSFMPDILPEPRCQAIRTFASYAGISEATRSAQPMSLQTSFGSDNRLPLDGCFALWHDPPIRVL